MNVLTGLGTLVTGLAVELRLPLPPDVAKLLGLTVLAVGIGLIAWAVFHIRSAFLGEVEPTVERLATDGPYRFVRHPAYLGMTIALLGATIAMRSWPAILVLFFLFLPSEIYRAKLEEQALARKFGPQWESYAEQTPFLLPFI
jgi:protein-S-isoprenylcysteine O-methyltransferase Ste14